MPAWQSRSTRTERTLMTVPVAPRCSQTTHNSLRSGSPTGIRSMGRRIKPKTKLRARFCSAPASQPWRRARRRVVGTCRAARFSRYSHAREHFSGARLLELAAEMYRGFALETFREALKSISRTHLRVWLRLALENIAQASSMPSGQGRTPHNR